MKKILVADGPDIDGRMGRILKPYELTFVRTLNAATRALDASDYDLIVIGVHFDDSRMFDLLRLIRSEERTRDAPVVCILSQHFETVVSVQGLEIAARTLAANAFIDFTKYQDGDDGNAAILRLIEDCLGR
jgi:DNA-binding response OmpR family regulator